MTEAFDAIVLGAGAAGLMCAAVAGQRGSRVLVLDHADAPGKKILISGGGRCNFTNVGTVPERFLSANPHYARSALSRVCSARNGAKCATSASLSARLKVVWSAKTQRAGSRTS